MPERATAPLLEKGVLVMALVRAVARPQCHRLKRPAAPQALVRKLAPFRQCQQAVQSTERAAGPEHQC